MSRKWILCECALLFLACRADRIRTAPAISRSDQPQAGWADLTPGMQLKVDGAYYRSGSSIRNVQNYLGGQAATYMVETGGGLKAISTSVLRPDIQRASGQPVVPSLIGPRLRSYHYHRLMFQVVLAAGGTRKAILIGAQSASDMERLTAQLLQSAARGCDPAHCTAFPEWCTASVFITVTVNGDSRVVSWGSAIGSVAAPARHISVLRSADRTPGRAPIPVDINDAESLRMPLIQGDQIVWD